MLIFLIYLIIYNIINIFLLLYTSLIFNKLYERYDNYLQKLNLRINLNT